MNNNSCSPLQCALARHRPLTKFGELLHKRGYTEYRLVRKLLGSLWEKQQVIGNHGPFSVWMPVTRFSCQTCEPNVHVLKREAWFKRKAVQVRKTVYVLHDRKLGFFSMLVDAKPICSEDIHNAQIFSSELDAIQSPAFAYPNTGFVIRKARLEAGTNKCPA